MDTEVIIVFETRLGFLNNLYIWRVILIADHGGIRLIYGEFSCENYNYGHSIIDTVSFKVLRSTHFLILCPNQSTMVLSVKDHL